MPWKETCAVEQRIRFVVEWEQGVLPVAVLCRKYGISRKAAYKWLKRFDEGELAGLADRSRAPLRHPNRVEPGVEQAIGGSGTFSWRPCPLRALGRYGPTKRARQPRPSRIDGPTSGQEEGRAGLV